MTSFDPHSISAHAPFLKRLAQGLLSSPDLVDDAVQETTLLAWCKEATTKAWAARTLRNVVRNQRRGSRRRTHHEHVGSRLASDASSLREREMLRRKLMDAVFLLPEAQRDAIVLRFDDGLPVRKIAAMLDLPTHTVHNRISRGLKALRASLDAEYGGNGQGDSEQYWRAALAPLVMNGSTKAALGVGGWVVGKKVAIGLAALLLLGLGTHFAFRTDRSAASNTAPALADLSSGDRAFDVDQAPGLKVSNAAARDDLSETTEVADNIPRVHGRVVMQDGGQPIEGAPVLAFDYSKLETLRTVTDASGRYSFASTRGTSSPVHLSIRHPDFSTYRDDRAYPTTEEAAVELSKGGTILGRLASFDGIPVRNARIRAVHQSFNNRIHSGLPHEVVVERDIAVDSQDGTFRISGLRPGPYVLLIHTPNMPPTWGTGDKTRMRRGRIDLADDTKVDIGTVTIPRVLPFKIRVIDAHTEAPLHDVEFAWRRRIGRVSFDHSIKSPALTSDGDYLIPLFLSKRGGVRSGYLVMSKRGYADTTQSFAEQRPDYVFEFRMSQPGRIVAHIPDSPGASALVYGARVGEIFGVTNVDEDGAAEWNNVPAGGDAVLVIHDGVTREPRWTVPIHVRRGGTTHVTVGNKKKSIIHLAVTVSNEPYERASVSIDDSKRRHTRALTNSMGEIRFAGLGNDAHDIVVYFPDPMNLSAERRVNADTPRNIRFPLDLKHRIHGSVRWPRSTSPRGKYDDPQIVMQRADGTGWTYSARVERNGSFKLMVEDPGTYKLELNAPKHALMDSPGIEVHEGDNEIGVLRVRPKVQVGIEFTVVDAETRKPIEKGYYEYRIGNQFDSSLFLGGEVTVNLFAGDTCSFSFEADKYIRSTFELKVPDGPLKQSRRVELTRANGVRVLSIDELSRSGDAGLHANDVILSSESAQTPNEYALHVAIMGADATDTVAVEVLREDRIVKLMLPGGHMGIDSANAHVKRP